MRNTLKLLSLLIFIFSFCLFPSCSSQIIRETATVTVTVTDYDAMETLQNRCKTLEAELDAVKKDAVAQTSLYETQITEMQSTIMKLKAEIVGINGKANSADDPVPQTLHNPSWQELKNFLINDTTDTFPYDKSTFDCSGYALILRDRARAHNIRTAYVEIELEDTSGHALNAFETDTNLLIFVDVTEGDKIAYTEKGDPYGTIALEAVKEKYISCDGAPDKFWMPLTYTTTSNPFSYQYFQDYIRRWEFYYATVEAFNHEVQKFNNRLSSLTVEQMDAWKNNITALETEIGNIYYEPMEKVLNIELYWGENP